VSAKKSVVHVRMHARMNGHVSVEMGVFVCVCGCGWVSVHMCVYVHGGECARVCVCVEGVCMCV
jgi:hypothetical protein